VQTDVTADQCSSATFVVRRVGASRGAVSVDYATFVDPGSAAMDYARLAGTVTWPDGDASAKGIRVSINIDGERTKATSVSESF
jgi:hypothetical protein